MDKIDGTALSQCLCEIEAKEKLLKYAKAYRFTKQEIENTKKLLELDKEELKRLMGG